MFWNNKKQESKQESKQELKQESTPIVYDYKEEYGQFERINESSYESSWRKKYKSVKFGEFNFTFIASMSYNCLKRIWETSLTVNFLDKNLVPHELMQYQTYTCLNNFKAYTNVKLMRDLDMQIGRIRNNTYYTDTLGVPLAKFDDEEMEKLECDAKELAERQKAFDTHKEKLFEERLLVKGLECVKIFR